MKYDFTLPSSDNKVKLALHLEGPLEATKIVLICHGMSEHKERYYDFIHFLNKNGFLCIAYDHRGHGDSVNHVTDYGYFYDESGQAIINDLEMICRYIKATYPEKQIYLFAHSMGTLVARNFIQTNDTAICKLILSGPPYHNKAAGFAYHLAKTLTKIFGGQKRSKFMHQLAFASFDKKFEEPIKNAWINSNREEVELYNHNTKCGFIFTNNGFACLFYLLKNCFKKEKYQCHNPNLPILIIAGQQDPVVGNKTQRKEQIDFLNQVGYANISFHQYPNMRHELLNETNKQQIYNDVLTHLLK